MLGAFVDCALVLHHSVSCCFSIPLTSDVCEVHYDDLSYVITQAAVVLHGLRVKCSHVECTGWMHWLGVWFHCGIQSCSSSGGSDSSEDGAQGKAAGRAQCRPSAATHRHQVVGVNTLPPYIEQPYTILPLTPSCPVIVPDVL